ncbi:hypothetical protein CCHR01_18795 [Colletotrichum chrysophilum]|uniref:GIY-YIG domain-containing protein n=1 Tax=Colletotrichum chrysophilum TaxID=1836956 RepID=A0AAD9A3W0_9PEZI|nr:hypothetical protein CCHR01_18795 [Colletotrichum chrysophilum]
MASPLVDPSSFLFVPRYRPRCRPSCRPYHSDHGLDSPGLSRLRFLPPGSGRLASAHPSNMEDLEEFREIVDGLTYCAVTPHAPEWYLNPVFMTILGAEDGVFESLCDDHPLFFADHFLRVLKDDEPPSLDFFRLLSSPARGDKPIWGCLLSCFREGLLCWHNMPSAAHVPRARVRLVAVEAVLTFVFFAGRACKQATWEPLCTHTAFVEKPPGDVNMSSKQLEAYNAARVARAKQNIAKSSKAYEDREKTEKKNPENIRMYSAGTISRRPPKFPRLGLDWSPFLSLPLLLSIVVSVVVSVVVSAISLVKAVIAFDSFAERICQTEVLWDNMFAAAHIQLSYIWCALSASTLAWNINHIFKSYFAPNIKTFEAICGQHPLKFADNMYEVLMAKRPPTLDFFRTLPKPNKSNPVWGVYTILMEKANHPAKLYVGSGTNADHGVVTRLRDYKRETLLPQLVLKALQEGYSISHAGLLCWYAMPKPGQAPIARLRVITVKATMAFVFFAGRPCKMDVLWDDMLPWTRDGVSWQPLCTHTAFLEKPPGDLDMSEEELESYNTQRRERALVQMKINSREYEDREKAVSLGAYRGLRCSSLEHVPCPGASGEENLLRCDGNDVK